MKIEINNLEKIINYFILGIEFNADIIISNNCITDIKYRSFNGDKIHVKRLEYEKNYSLVNYLVEKPKVNNQHEEEVVLGPLKINSTHPFHVIREVEIERGIKEMIVKEIETFLINKLTQI